LARTIANVLEERKGENIVLLDILGLSDFADYFVICSGSSDRMLSALADDVVDHMRDHHKIKARPEGLARDGWVLVDYGAVVLHLFSPDRRDFYSLEDLWGQGKVLLHLQ
jgi:ribosome-associated protein